MSNHAVLGGQLYREGLEDETPEGEAVRAEVGERIQRVKGREFHTLGTVLGLCYDNSPITCRDGSAGTPSSGPDYQPSAKPGCLAPHAWLPDGRSLYDLFGHGFTLVVAESADESQVAAAERDARDAGVALQVVRPVGVPVKPLYRADLTLVRPDQHVAWRGSRWAGYILRRATGRVDADAATA